MRKWRESWELRSNLPKVQLHELVQKSRHDLRLAQAHGVMKSLEVYEVCAVNAGSFAEHRVSNRTPPTLQGAVFDVVRKKRG